LLPEDIADTIAYCINVPERVSIAEIAIYPKRKLSRERFIEINCYDN
jgi:NADP-dependent 3-hydroxy acid dehydrogenase YdfG